MLPLAFWYHTCCKNVVSVGFYCIMCCQMLFQFFWFSCVSDEKYLMLPICYITKFVLPCVSFYYHDCGLSSLVEASTFRFHYKALERLILKTYQATVCH